MFAYRPLPAIGAALELHRYPKDDRGSLVQTAEDDPEAIQRAYPRGAR